LPALIDPAYEPCVAARPARFETALQDDWWDVVTVQVYQGSTFANDMAALNTVIDAVERGPGGATTRVMLYSPWPRRDVDYDGTWHEMLPSVDDDTTTRHSLQYLRSLADAISTQRQREVGIIPVAEVLGRLRGELMIGDAGTEWIYRDAEHASHFGRYVVIASTLTALLAEPLPDDFSSRDYFVADGVTDLVVDSLSEGEESLIRDTAWQVMQDIAEVDVARGPGWWCP